MYTIAMYLYGKTLGTPVGVPTDIVAPTIGTIQISSQSVGGPIVGIDIDRVRSYAGASVTSNIVTGGRPVQYLGAGFTGGIMRAFGVSTDKSFSEFPTVGAFIAVDIASPPFEALHNGRQISDRTNVGYGDTTFPYMIGFRVWRSVSTLGPNGGYVQGGAVTQPITAIAAIYMARCPAGQAVQAGQCVAKLQCVAPATYVPATATSPQKCVCPPAPTGYEYVTNSCTLVKSLPAVQSVDTIGTPSGRGAMQTVFVGTPVAYGLTWDFILGQKALTGIMLRDSAGKVTQVGAPGSNPTLLEQPMSGMDYTTATDATVQTIFTAIKLLTTPPGGLGATRRVKQIKIGYEQGGPIRGFEISYETETCPASTYVGGSSAGGCLPLCKPDDVQPCICADPAVVQMKKDGSADVWNYTRCGWESTLPTAQPATPVGTMAASVQTTADYGSSVSAYTPVGVSTSVSPSVQPGVSPSVSTSVSPVAVNSHMNLWLGFVFILVVLAAVWFALGGRSVGAPVGAPAV